jgi:uncharacterized membrane protein YcgQ (UPF0703/DUF1980 family)
MQGSTMLTPGRRWGFEAVVGVMLVATRARPVPHDAWAQVEGTWDGIMTPGGEAPVVRVASVVEVGEPPLPYEF